MSNSSYLNCVGCGSLLQTNDPALPGYVPEAALLKDEVCCRRCFRIQNYGEVAPIEQDPDHYLEILDQIAYTSAVVVQVVDLFDFYGSWIPGVGRRIGNNPLLIVGNKIDLFPTSTKWNKLQGWIRHEAEELGVRPAEVLFASAMSGHGLERIIQSIEKWRDQRDVYIIGTTNVGKSTFVNQLIYRLGLQESQKVTTSPYPGTTLNCIRIPFADGKMMVDTPGIVRKDRYSEWVSPRDLKTITPTHAIKPRVYQLNASQTLFFGGLARLDYVDGPCQPFVCYQANQLYIHRTKREKADEIYQKQQGQLLVPPYEKIDLPEWKRWTFSFSDKQKRDIVISGLGWIRCFQQPGEVHVWAPRGINVMARPAMI